MQTIMLAGAGSVGKTKAMEAILSLCERKGIDAVCHSSTTRQTYAKAGFAQESDALKDPIVNMEFQRTVMDDNTAALRNQMVDNKHVDLMVCDRSPYDYASYWTSVFREHLTLNDLSERQRAADKAMAMVMAHSSTVHLFVLPYPAHWSQDTESSDGWRKDTNSSGL